MSLTSGRPRKPAAKHTLEGTARKSRINARAPKPKVTELPPPPRDLTKAEQSAWRSLSKVVSPLKVATAADMIAFRQMAVTLALIDQARVELREEGGTLTYTLMTESGAVIRPRPQVAIIATFKKQLAVELSRFGLTPADRERVSALSDENAVDPLDEFAIGGSNGP